MQNEAAKKIGDKFNMANFEMNSMDLYQFEDVDYQKKKRQEEIQKMNDYITSMMA